MPAERAPAVVAALSVPMKRRAAQLVSLDWRACIPLLIFILIEHGLVLTVLQPWSLPYALPRDVTTLLPLFALGGPLFGAFMLVGPLFSDFRRQRNGLPVPPLADRLVDAGKVGMSVGLMGAAFYLHMLASANLKPAYFAIRGVWFDHAIESAERGLFGGVLPTEWLVSVLPAAAMWFWQYVYDTFSVYLFLTVALAAHLDGLRGAVRYTLSLCMGHGACLWISLAWPTMGPVFVHRDWYAHLPPELPTLIFSSQLLQTVDNYTHFRLLTHTVCGISAMPSYHVLAWMCGVYVWTRLGRGAAIGVWLFVLANWASTVILGWHYALDGLVGIGLGVLAWQTANRLVGPPKAPSSVHNV